MRCSYSLHERYPFRRFSRAYFSALALNFPHFLRTRKTPNTDIFQAVTVKFFLALCIMSKVTKYENPHGSLCYKRSDNVVFLIVITKDSFAGPVLNWSKTNFKKIEELSKFFQRYFSKLSEILLKKVTFRIILHNVHIAKLMKRRYFYRCFWKIFSVGRQT